MKKVFLFLSALLCATTMLFADGSYGILINGNKVVAATDQGDVDVYGTTYNQHYASVQLSANDVVKLVNLSSGDTWMVDLDPYGEYTKFSGGASTGQIVCSTAGCYDFYLKLKYGEDILYIGSGTGDCSTGVDYSGGGGGGSSDDDCQDGPYGIQINGDSIVYARATGLEDYQGRTQYLAHVQLASGDICKLINTSCGATWMVDLDPYDEYVNFEGGASAGQITCKKDGCYDFYIKLMMNDDLLYIGSGTECDGQSGGGGGEGQSKGSYGSQVPSQSTDVMLQGFYYDSYTSKKYNGVQFNDTKWASLLTEVAELGTYFDLVWLPPSAKSSGGTGYHPSQYSNQNSAWGSRTDLEKLITAFHNSTRKTKVVADIVVNHMDNKSTWCDFWPEDFGTYGTFQPEASWITANDELATSSSAGACKGKQGTNYDDGYGDEANYAAARDLDHNNSKVREMCKAYLQWMYNVVGYDGWRYDYCKGFHTSHVNDYNKASGAYFSVMEWWDGNPSTLKSRIEEAGYNTLTFDFATKYTAINDPDNSSKGIAGGNYSTCKGAGLPGMGMSKYAVTFIDSHDSFERDNNEFLGKGNSSKSANKDKLLQANAYILSMPGIPCVFYPHWSLYKTEIGKMIMARHAAQVHSESSVSDEADSNGYKAVVTGKNGGSLILLLGNRVSQTIGSDYTLAVKGSGYAVYYKAASGSTDDLSLTVSPGSSTFKDKTAGIDVTIKAVALQGTPVVYYTTDGTEPSATNGNKLSGDKLNFKETTTLKVMAVNGSTTTAVQTYTYTYKEPQTTPIIVRFYKPSSWAKLYLYSWDNSALPKGLSTWPGLELTSPDADGWYSYQYPAEIKEVKFIFNAGSGKEQTSDLWTDEDVCYSWSGGAEKLEEDCDAPTAVENVKTVENITIYPNPVRDQLNISTESAIQATYIYNVAGQCQKVVEGNQKQIDVNDMAAGMYILQLQTKDGKKATQLFIKQ